MVFYATRKRTKYTLAYIGTFFCSRVAPSKISHPPYPRIIERVKREVTHMEPEDPNSPKKPSKGYGKHSVWFWVAVYVVIAIVVYGLIYILFIHKSGSGGGGGGLNY